MVSLCDCVMCAGASGWHSILFQQYLLTGLRTALQQLSPQQRQQVGTAQPMQQQLQQKQLEEQALLLQQQQLLEH